MVNGKAIMPIQQRYRSEFAHNNRLIHEYLKLVADKDIAALRLKVAAVRYRHLVSGWINDLIGGIRSFRLHLGR